MSGIVPAEAPFLRDVEVLAQSPPDLPQVNALLDEVLDRLSVSGQHVGVDDETGAGPPELVLEELVEFRQSHAPIVQPPGSTAPSRPDGDLNTVHCYRDQP